MDGATHDAMNGGTVKSRTPSQVDALVRMAWGTEIAAEEIALALGVCIGFVGLKVVELQLPARDHNRKLIAGTVSTPMHAARTSKPEPDEGETA